MRRLSHFAFALALWLAPDPGVTQLPAAEPFDYFRNSWQVIGLKDYPDGTRITPQNELVLAGQRKLRLACGPALKPLGRLPVKTLLQGWLPIVLLHAEESGVRYEFTLWATPLPAVKDWRAAFDWPTEGDDFMNWIRVKAVNLGTAPAEARVRLDLLAKTTNALTNWLTSLKPGQVCEAAFCLPFRGATNAASDALLCDARDARVWLGRTAKFWQDLLARGARVEVPCAKATQALKAAHVCQFLANDRGELHAGEGFYDEFYIRDGGYQVLELEEAGLWPAARKALESYLRAQRPDGRFESQKDQLDANGQALWTFWQYWKISGDLEWLRRVYPQMRRAAQWVQQARRQAPPDAPFAGLLPAAVADGEYLWDGKHHIVGYDFWNLRGLLCVADAARALGESAEAGAFEREASDYRVAIDAAWRRTGLPHFPPSWEKAGTPWGNTETLWPTELFARDDPHVTATLAEVRERHGGGFVEGTMRWTGHSNVIHPYLSSYTTMASLVRGEHGTFAEEFYWYLLHSSASHAFPEGVYFKRRYAWSETIPHVLGAANFAFLLRHALVHERGEELHLLSGVPDWWLDNGHEIRVENAPTHFGPMSLRVRGRAKGVEVKLDAPRRTPPRRILLHLPASRPALRVPPAATVVPRAAQARRWDFPTVVGLYETQAAPPARAIPGLVTLPLEASLPAGQCEPLDLSKLANTDPFNAPFGVPRPGRYLFRDLPVGLQTVAGVPFRIPDPAQHQGRGLVVLHGASACQKFPREVEVVVRAQGRRLFFLGNVHGWSPDDEGAGDWGALAEYVIHYADGPTQTVPLVAHRTTDDWASPPDAGEVVAALTGDPWHLNVLGVSLRPAVVEKVVFRDLGTPAAPVLVAVTLEK